jgi:hypothetical protein
MTAVPEAPAPPGRKRVGVDLPDDIARRLRTWAAMRGQPASHVAAEVITAAVPTDAQLAAQIQQNGAGDGRPDD